MKISGLYKSFGKLRVLNGIDADVPAGKITAVVGPNGSGKTTLLKCILGMVIPDQGRILVEGLDISGKWEYKKHIGYLPQIARFPENLRMFELVKMVRDIRGSISDEERIISLFGLEPYVRKPLRNLSGGTRQKINIMLAFMFDTPYYILDEPTVGLDPLSIIRFKKLLSEEKEKGKAILLTTHIISLVEELADEVIFLLEGSVHIKGPYTDMIREHGNKKLDEILAGYLLSENHV